MIHDLRAITLFVKTVELGSFRACADHFKLSPSVVSQHIGQLEQKHNIALLYRSTRKLSLSHDGQLFYQEAKKMVEAADKAVDLLSGASPITKGRISVTCPAALIRAPLWQKIAQFLKDNTRIEIDLRCSDERIDLIGEGVDLAIRVGDLKNSNLRSTKIATIQRKLVCTPAYFADHPLPKRPEDLKDWDWIKMKMMPPYRRLINKNGVATDIHAHPRIEVDSVEAMYQFSRLGLGLSSPPDYMVTDDLKKGDLIEVLPDWMVSDMQVYALWPENVRNGSLTNQLVEHLKSQKT